MDSITTVSLGSVFPQCYSTLESLVNEFSSEMKKSWQNVLATNQGKTQIPEREWAQDGPLQNITNHTVCLETVDYNSSVLESNGA